MNVRRAAVALTLASGGVWLAGEAAGAGQVAPTSTGLILGRVVDAESTQPISGVLVSLGGGGPMPGPSPAGIQWRLLTDSQGRFVFRNLPKGSYTLSATVGGTGFSPSGFLTSGMGHQIGAYLNGGYGQRRPGGPMDSIDLTEGERIADAVIRLWRGGAIDGTVVDEVGEPLVGLVVAAVRRTSDGGLLTGPTTRTDDRGAYHLGTLLPGEYVVVVPQTQLMLPYSTVETLASPDAAVPERLSTAMSGPGVSRTTGIAVGSSRVLTVTSPTPNSNALPPPPAGAVFHAYQTTFHSSAVSAARAMSIAVRSGEDRVGVNVQLRPVPAVEVSGTLTDGIGPVADFGIHLLPADVGDGASVLEVARTATDASGAFTFALVPSGQYTLLATRRVSMPARRGTPPQEPLSVADRVGAWAAFPLSVGDQHIRNVSLGLRAAAQLSGRMEFQGAGERPGAERLRQIALLLARTPPLFRDLTSPPPGVVDPNGDFVIPGQPPGRYVIRVPVSPPGWALQSITIGGVDVTDAAFAMGEKDIAGIVMVFTDKPPELTGIVRGANGAPDPDASVFVFPANRARWPDAPATARSFRTVRASKIGAFTVTGLIPGEYLVAAASDAIAGDWPDRRLLTRLAASATSVRIDVGQKPAVTLKTAELR